MQGIRWTPGMASASGIVRVIVGIVLFVLVTGIWACLWVPPSPIF